jgi:hypothetical protein
MAKGSSSYYFGNNIFTVDPEYITPSYTMGSDITQLLSCFPIRLHVPHPANFY